MMNFDDFELRPSKHFRNTWMLKWNLDMQDLRVSLREAYKMGKVGKYKYEAYTKYKSEGKSRKIIFAVNEIDKIIYIITGAEGK